MDSSIRRLFASSHESLKFWAIAAFFLGSIAYTVQKINYPDRDIFHEMALYREYLIRGELPLVDLFAYTDTVSPSVHHEWGTGAILYWCTVGCGMGAYGLALLRLVLISVLMWTLVRIARIRGADPVLLATWSWLIFPVLLSGFSLVRAQLFTLVFLALQMLMQELDHRGKRIWIVAWLVMLVAWLNMHAGFVVGLGMIACHTLERWAITGLETKSFSKTLHATWHLLAAAPVAAACTFLTPYGLDFHKYLVRAITMPRPLITEWSPLWSLPILEMVPFGAGLSLFCYGIFHRWSLQNRSHFRGAAFLVLSALMAIKHVRHGSIFAVVWLAYVPAWLANTSRGQVWIKSLRNSSATNCRLAQAIAFVSVGLILGHSIWLPRLHNEHVECSDNYPIHAVDYLRDCNFSGNVCTTFENGSYLSWMLHPHVKVSLDGRYEVAYRPHMLPEHCQFFAAQGNWWTFLDRYATDLVLIPKEKPVSRVVDRLSADCPENERLPTRQKWEVIHEDESFLLLANESSASSLRGRYRNKSLGKTTIHDVFSWKHSHVHHARMAPTNEESPRL